MKFIPFMARCRVPGWGTGNFNSYFDLDPIFFRYAREKPKKSEEKKQKRAKRDEAQHSMKVVLIILMVSVPKISIALCTGWPRQHSAL